MSDPLVILDDRRVLRLLGDPSVLAAIPPLADAARKYAEANAGTRGGCGGCGAKRKAAAGKYTLANVKSVIGTLSGQHVNALKAKLNARKYQITYLSPGKRMIKLTT